MKIIHAPIDIAGQMGVLCDALLERGCHPVGYNYFRTYLGYENKRILHTDLFEISKFIGEYFRFFDLCHFHYASTFFNDYRDLELLHHVGKPAVMHHWGNDVRKPSLATQSNPYVNTEDSPSEEVIDARLSVLGKYIPTAIVQDAEVLNYVKPYYEHVYILPLAIETRRFIPRYPSQKERHPLVVHAPTQPKFKGTAIIEDVVHRLQKLIPFRYQRIEQKGHQEAMQFYKQADIIIDQVLCGSYGLLSVEAMALGKPVITYVKEEYMEKELYQELPICNAHPHNLYDVLQELLLDGRLRRERGQLGRHFVERYHDSSVVVEKLLAIYRQQRMHG